MRAKEFITESPATELAKQLPGLSKHNYNTIDALMKKIARRHSITGKALHDLFVDKYKKTPDNWIKGRLDESTLVIVVDGKPMPMTYHSRHEAERDSRILSRRFPAKKVELKQEVCHLEDLTESAYYTCDIIKPVLFRTGKANDSSIIREQYSRIVKEQHGLYINATTDLMNNLLPHLQESMPAAFQHFNERMANLSKNNRVRIKIGSKLCLLQTVLDIYNHTIILRGFRNPKTIVDIVYDGDKIKQIEFEDGTTFPEKHEFSTTNFGTDLLRTLFFKSSADLEKTMVYITLISPPGFELGTKLLTENKIDSSKEELSAQVDKFVKWFSPKLQLESEPNIELSYDTEEAQRGHHTGRHTPGDGKIWVYVANRNLVDILRTVAHEMTHLKQGELGMIKAGDSYPGSPIEAEADKVAGEWIKRYGEKNHDIFQ
jgi:hypothetical protein